MYRRRAHSFAVPLMRTAALWLTYVTGKKLAWMRAMSEMRIQQVGGVAKKAQANTEISADFFASVAAQDVRAHTHTCIRMDTFECRLHIGVSVWT